MLDKKRTAIIFTANTPHLAHANLMIDSLRDKERGNFQGDLWVISTGLSDRAKNYCDSNDIKFLVNNLSSLEQWSNWKNIAKAQPEYKEYRKTKSEEVSLRNAFEAYRNKRMSKLIILDWIKKFGDKYDFIALGDNDLFFQKDIHILFEEEYDNSREKIHYSEEEYEILPGSWLWNKDFHYSRLADTSEMDWGKHEINIGFILGTPGVMKKLFEMVKQDFYNLDIALFTQFNWHDQDLVRVVRARHSEMFYLMEKGKIAHLCAGGDTSVEERYPLEFYYKKNDTKPYVIHFADGMWKKYPGLSSAYKVEPDVFYFTKEIEQSYNVIRRGSIVNIFDQANDLYYTEQNKRTKKLARDQWLKLRDNKKKKFLFIGWLQTGTHKSTIDNLPGVFYNDVIDLAVLNGNVVSRTYDDIICEEFPKIIAELSRIIKDQYLIRTYGFEIPNVPQWLFEDTIVSAMAEYNCTRKTALALANICYYYFTDALSFYYPDVVLLWGFLSPWGKLINNLCKWKGIPITSLEWGILPGTVSFDFCGHMGDSWVTRNADFFNSLEVSEKDLSEAREYLSEAANPDLSRNLPQTMDESVIRKILAMKAEGIRILLYMESNSAHSGNTYSNPERAKYHSPLFVDDCDAYEYVNQVCKRHPDWHILYKPHPVSISRGLKTVIDNETTTVIFKGGLNEALALADMSITILSQSAYVSMLEKVPTLVLGTIQLNGSGAVYVAKNKGDIEEICITALKEGITKTQNELFEQHVARALKYYVFKANNNLKCRDSYELIESVCKIIAGDAADFYRYEMESYKQQLLLQKKGNMNSPLVSIVMPVYNAEDYLASCLDSICNQTYINWELICVNNGSTDNTEEILQYYKQKDERIFIHAQKEPNQRIARNWGFDKAKGKYLYLIDSDDYLDLNALEMLVSVAEEKQADLLYFFFREVRTDTNPVRPRPRYYNYLRFFPSERVFKLDRSMYKFFIQYPFPWAKLMRRDFVMENNLYFDLDCGNFDDNPHNLRTLLSAQNPYVINEKFYNFRIHTKSMTQSKNSRILSMVDAVRIMNDIYNEKNCNEEFQKWYVPYKVHLISWAWVLLPDELRKEYYRLAKNLFTVSDEEYFFDETVWSYYEIPSVQQVNFVRSILHDEEFEKKFIDCDSIEIITEDIVRKEPWEQISKPHLWAIKVCEKLHIIKFAISLKHFFIKGNRM
ncbi:MAG: glycosyltransferase [Blautia sp.]|nr:glycosyltransferase [Blautia sp.]MCM1201381.1 glycosyltransferase [Bacteroides fragilis]